MENESDFDHEHCHATIDRLKMKLIQCALELTEAAALLRPSFPACSKLFIEAARVAAEQ